ncbi:GABA and glycine transporter Solute carrier family 32 member 1 Vesicular [Triplophysa tibetana]|uniref:Vesicular inhibitory amino acid transporter n=1 Tax=Triplophysa tibetana TaxID=1572043 RepID=A0A5A9NJF3_9TELE|nr:GABA and glycine transporter Solute carrier family 32 member 1 Vesicular [Triplophysa tibetana]
MSLRRVESLWMKHFCAGDVEESQALVPRDDLAECSCDSPPDEDSDPLQRPKISTWEAGWNITNAIQGLFVLSLPFALHQSGYVGLVVLISAASSAATRGRFWCPVCMKRTRAAVRSVSGTHTRTSPTPARKHLPRRRGEAGERRSAGGSMTDRRDFSRMMDCTHALGCVLKTAFSLLAFLTRGEETKEALLSYPLPFYAAAEIYRTAAAETDTSSGHVTERQTLLLRASLLILILVMSLYVPHFSLLMGLTGSVTGALMTLMLPALFHLQLKWTQLHMTHKLLDVMILLLGCFCSISGLICSIKRIITAFGYK